MRNGDRTASAGKNHRRPNAIRLLAGLLLLGAAASAHAIDCSELPNGVLDGATGATAPSQIQIDRTCTIRNFPADNPLDTNFSFYTQPGQNEERWVVIFDNVVHTGQMSCNSVLEHKIWFTNGSSTSIQEGCQNLLIPVEKIDKQNPPGQTTAAVGVPFTYRLTMPVLFDPATGTVINYQGSLNDLHSVTLWDDLNATGVDLTYLGHTAYWKDSGAPVPHTFENNGGDLTLDGFPVVPAGEQIIVEITVVLEDTPNNTVGKQFVNTAKWDFGRLIDGVFYEPLPGEWGISEPLTIGGPDLVMTKSGPAVMNLGQSGEFTLDLHNVGNGDAWNARILDNFPDGPQGGMCELEPQVLSAQVFASDGVTPVPGKGPLVEGTDFVATWESAPRCRLTLEMLSPDSAIGADEHLVVTYVSELDPDTGNGVQLTNVAGAAAYYNGDDSNPDRQGYLRPVSTGTVGTADHQDAHTVTTALRGYFFEKTVANLTSGQSPAETAAPGDRLRYTLRLQTTDSAINNVTIHDDLGAMNAGVVFEPGSLVILPGSLPPGANASNTDPSGGTNGAGIVEVRNLSLPVADELQFRFDVTVAQAALDGDIITNQADLLVGNTRVADSDDPTVNGQADPDVPGDEDPTTLAVERVPPAALAKATTQATATIGETFSYRITVPSAPHVSPLYDVRISDNLGTSAADLEFVSVTRISGPGSWTPANTGSATDLLIEDPVSGIDIPAGEQAVLEIAVRLADTPANVAGLTFTNTAAYTYDQLDGNDATRRPGDPGTSGPMTIVEPELTVEKSGPPSLRLGQAGGFTLDVHNAGTSPAFNLYLVDVLPDTADGGMCAQPPAAVAARIFEADGSTPAGPALADGSDFRTTFAGAPDCRFTFEALGAAAAIGPDQRLLLTYEASLDPDTVRDTVLTNVAAATGWSSTDASQPDAAGRQYSRSLTDGTVGTLDHEDAHTLVEFTPLLVFEKTVANLSRGTDPGTAATPGETLRYSLRIENASTSPVSGFAVVDELDRLNGSASFAPGSLSVVTLPAGADDQSDPAGGARGTGLLDIRDLDLGGLGDSLLIEFEVTLAPALPNASYVSNQSEVRYAGQTVALSDDPGVNGAADPNVAGDEDPTRVYIESAPVLDVDKISTYITGSPDVLLAGETLRYTITLRNVGTDHATGVTLADAIPPNTSYVPGSTTLNGAAVPDSAGGGSPLTAGIPVNAPADPAPGSLPADVSGSPDNVATVVFDVVVDPDLLDGTVLSNQAFASAPDAGILDQPSDDPRTPIADDPTRDVVGNAPLLFAPKSAALTVDNGTPGIVDPGDVLRYTITVYNNGRIPATEVTLTDAVPQYTTWVADSLTLNGLPVGQPDGGISPLANGIPVSSADLTPPLPGDGQGTLTAGEAAVVQFDLRVDDGVAPGTIISNQAVVGSYELADLLTDGDGNPATGPEPTIVVVGDVQQLAITKQVFVVDGGPALAGATLEYVVTVSNPAQVPAFYVELSDELDEPDAGQLGYVDGSATLNGSATGVTVNGSLITADYSANYGPLEPGDTAVLRFRAVIEPTLPIGTRVTNVARVYWNDPQQTASASVSIDVGGTPGTGALNGSVWHDTDFDDTADDAERRLAGWTVELFLDGDRVHGTETDEDGAWRMTGLPPNYLTDMQYAVVFSAPGAGPSTAALGRADSDFTNYLQRIDNIVLNPGSNLLDLNLPIDPNGVVYNALARTPIAGAVVTLLDANGGTPLPASCFDDPQQQNQVTPGDGWYKFVLNFSEPACPGGGDYVIRVTPPGAGYEARESELIPPLSSAATPPFDVPACPGSGNDAIAATAQHCEVQASAQAPGAGVPASGGGTAYHSHLTLDDTVLPGTGEIFNNHIPLDPVLDGAVTVTKTTPLVDVTRGQLVPYVITVRNSIEIQVQDVTIVDRMPAGFRYVEGSARFDGVPVEPQVNGIELAWPGRVLDASGSHTLKLLLAVGAGVSEGEFVNRAQALSSVSGAALSGEATATVRLVPDPTFDCTDVTGKVYDDHNRNGYQDGDEGGLAGVRLVTARGLAATTDNYGRFHFTCAITPNEDRGSNFVVKLDDRTLPSGYRMSTRTVQVKRATRGKALRFNFGASIHRVVGLDIAGAAFEPDSVHIRRQWQPRLDLLMEELRKGPAVLRLSYLADLERPSLVERRLDAVRTQIETAWTELDCCYELVVEPEIFWRLGKPAKTPDEPEEAGR